MVWALGWGASGRGRGKTGRQEFITITGKLHVLGIALPELWRALGSERRRNCPGAHTQ